MFEDKNINEFDQMMKSILDEGREEVPASVWEGVSAGLDKADRRKTTVLWWRRAAVGAAAAAAVAAGVLLYDGQPELTPDASDDSLIAVVEPVEPTETETATEHHLEPAGDVYLLQLKNHLLTEDTADYLNRLSVRVVPKTD